MHTREEDEARWVTCDRCAPHLRVEHAKTGKRCEVREGEGNCKCPGFVARGGPS